MFLAEIHRQLIISDACEIVKILLEKGADVNQCGTIHNCYKSSFGHWRINHYDLVNGGYGLLDDVFPLFVSLYDHDMTTLKSLLSAGADINQQTAIGQTALHALCTTQDGGHGVDNFSLHDEYPSNNKTVLIRLLIDHGADVNICDNSGRSPLQVTCMLLGLEKSTTYRFFLKKEQIFISKTNLE